MRHLWSLPLLILGACVHASSSRSVAARAAAVEEAPAATVAAAEPEQDPELAAAKEEGDRRDLEREFRSKRRELAALEKEHRANGIGREVAVISARQSVAAAERALAKARRELEVFLEDVRPREVEEKEISFAQQQQYAREAEAELAELRAMYEKDEFATTTKELVIDRGERKAEFARRRLGLAQRELRHFVEHTMAVKEQDLRQAVATAEIDLEKARKEVQKGQIERELQVEREKTRVDDLKEEMEEMRKKRREAIR